MVLARSGRIGSPTAGLVASLRVIPSLALVFLFVPWLGFGYRPALLALVLLAAPPIVLNTFAGLRGVDPAAIEAARKRAIELDTQMCIAVVDSGANLKAFIRMDDSWVGSIDIAIKKAKTAVFFGMATGELGKLSQPGKSLWGIEHSNEGLITFPGGLPIVDEDGVLVGAIGVSGSSVENDHKVAEAGVKVVGLSELPAHPWRT